MNTARPPFPIAIDSSMRAAFVACPRKFELTYLHHWKPKGESVHLVAGKAFASGLEAARLAFYATGLSPDEAIAQGAKALIHEYGTFDCPSEFSNKSCPAMLEALQDYFHHYGFATDAIQPYRFPGGEPAIEFNFALELDPDLRHPESNDPILFTGRFDMLGVHMGENIWGIDEKTTGSLGKTWYNNWPLRSQLTGYTWAARQHGIPAQGVIIRGIALLKRSINHAESIQSRAPWEVDRWHAQFVRDTRRMIQLWTEGYFDYSLDNACSDYGGCPFLKGAVCTSPNPERWLSTNFEKRVWNPLDRTETAA